MAVECVSQRVTYLQSEARRLRSRNTLKMHSVDIVQITDLHLGKAPDFILAGINPADSFNAVLDAVDRAGRGNDLLLLSGDLSGDSSAEAYVCLNEILQRRSKSVIWLPGNHDDLELMQAGLVNYPRSPVTQVGSWSIVSIDSSQSGTPAGFVSDSELHWLDAQLRQLSDRYACCLCTTVQLSWEASG